MNVFVGQLLIFKERSCCRLPSPFWPCLMALLLGFVQWLKKLANEINDLLQACVSIVDSLCDLIDHVRILRKKLHRKQKSRHKDD